MEGVSEARFMLRMPEALRDRVKRVASAERRSVNSQIVVLLERALPTNEMAETASAIPAE